MIKNLIIAGLATTALSASANTTLLNPNFLSLPGHTDYQIVTTPDRAGPGGSWVEGTDAVDVDANNDHALWYHVTSPTHGEMLIVNGATTQGKRVWYETIGPGTYDFSAWATGIYPASPATLHLDVGGLDVSDLTLTSTPGDWLKWNATFTIASAETISIYDSNLEPSGNDFALAGVPDGGMTAGLLGIAGAGLGMTRRFLKK